MVTSNVDETDKTLNSAGVPIRSGLYLKDRSDIEAAISTLNSHKLDKLIAGDGITIDGDTISATNSSEVTTSSDSLTVTPTSTPTGTSYDIELTEPIKVKDGGTGVSTITGMVKGNGSNAFTTAVHGVDYLSPGDTVASSGKLATPRNLQVELSNENPEPFDGSADVENIGVSGILPQSNGGTGLETFSPNQQYSFPNAQATTATDLNNVGTGKWYIPSTQSLTNAPISGYGYVIDDYNYNASTEIQISYPIGTSIFPVFRTKLANTWGAWTNFSEGGGSSATNLTSPNGTITIAQVAGGYTLENASTLTSPNGTVTIGETETGYTIDVPKTGAVEISLTSDIRSLTETGLYSAANSNTLVDSPINSNTPIIFNVFVSNDVVVQTAFSQNNFWYRSSNISGSVVVWAEWVSIGQNIIDLADSDNLNECTDPTVMYYIDGEYYPANTPSDVSGNAYVKVVDVLGQYIQTYYSADGQIFSRGYTTFWGAWTTGSGSGGSGITVTTNTAYQASTSGTITPSGTWITSMPSVPQGQWLWTRIITSYSSGTTSTSYLKAYQGNDGIDGTPGSDGASPVAINLSNEAHVFAGSATSAFASTATTDVTAFIGDTQYPVTVGTITGLPSGMTSSVSNNGTNDATITFSVTTSMVSTSGQVTIPVTVSDGSSNVTQNQIFSYALALSGSNGYTAILTNESNAFPATSDGAAIAGTATTTPIVYQGDVLQSVTVGTITGLPTGMTAAITNNGTTAPLVTFTVTTSLTTVQGAVTIPLILGSMTINKSFGYSLVVNGTNGTNGSNGVNVQMSSASYGFSANLSATSSGEQMTAVAGSTTTTFTATSGGSAIPVTSVTLSGSAPTGMTVTIGSVPSNSVVVTIAVTTSMVTANGSLTFNVTAGGVTVPLQFSYTLSISYLAVASLDVLTETAGNLTAATLSASTITNTTTTSNSTIVTNMSLDNFTITENYTDGSGAHEAIGINPGEGYSDGYYNGTNSNVHSFGQGLLTIETYSGDYEGGLGTLTEAVRLTSTGLSFMTDVPWTTFTPASGFTVSGGTSFARYSRLGVMGKIHVRAASVTSAVALNTYVNFFTLPSSMWPANACVAVAGDSNGNTIVGFVQTNGVFQIKAIAALSTNTSGLSLYFQYPID